MDRLLLNKIDARGRHGLLEGDLEGSVEVMIRTAAPLTPVQRRDLQTAGFQAHFASGTVLSGAVANASLLAELAELPFVSRIEVSRDVFPDR